MNICRALLPHGLQLITPFETPDHIAVKRITELLSIPPIFSYDVLCAHLIALVVGIYLIFVLCSSAVQ